MEKTLSNAGNSLDTGLPKGENVQLETISREEVSWLAGIIDGEGHIVLFNNYAPTSHQYRISANIGITNSDLRILAKVTDILYRNGNKFYYRIKKANNRSKWCMTVIVGGYRNCQKLLELVIPYLVGKKDQAEVMLQFIRHRKSAYNKHCPKLKANGQFAKGHWSYSAKDWEYYNKLRALKKIRFFPQRLQRRASQPLKLTNKCWEEGIV